MIVVLQNLPPSVNNNIKVSDEDKNIFFFKLECEY